MEEMLRKIFDEVNPEGPMYIKQFLRQYRRDFRAVFACEHCGFEEHRDGYDDSNFHDNVVPDMTCPRCQKKAGQDYRPYKPKHPDNMHL